MNNKLRGIALLMALVLAMAMVPFSALAEETDASSEQPISKVGTTAVKTDENSYKFYQVKQDFPVPAQAIALGVNDITSDTVGNVLTETDEKVGTVMHLKADTEVSFSVSVPADARYNVALTFTNLESTTEEYPLGVKIDGEIPFTESADLRLDALWEDDGGIRELSNGDQVSPRQKQVEGYVTQRLYDVDGIALAPFEYALTAGTHTLTLAVGGRDILVSAVALEVPETVEDYATVSAGYDKKDYYDGEQIVIEAEDSYHRNDYALTNKSDNGSANISPFSATQSKINYIGSTTWMEPGQEISWQFNAPKSGLYKLGFNYKQYVVTNGEVYRWLKIDGETPFAEASHVGFDYGVGWQFRPFANSDGEDYLIYLEEGPHIMSLSVTLYDIAEVYYKLEDLVAAIGDLYLDMVMITSDTVDTNRDYQLHEQIPDFVEILNSSYEGVDALSKEIEAGLKVNGELNGALKNMARILKDMKENIYDAHLYINTYYTAYQTLSAWLFDIKKMTLSLDQIILAAPEQKFDTPKAGFFTSLAFSFERFFDSFSRQTQSVVSGDNKDNPTIKIWVNWGRDQVKVLNTLVQDTFTPVTNVNVKVEQVNASLVQGLISGNPPDLYLHMSRTEPVNLAMRGVLYNLKNFDDYEETLGNFQEGAEIPYLYRDGCYALPDTQGFYVMFYRTDILKKMGIEVPKTWDEFLNATGILQRNNMNVYLPYTKITAATTVNTGTGGLSIFPAMLQQNGGSVYTADKKATALSSLESIHSFEFWTDFYTKYSLDQEANFQQKFRVGVYPLGIVGYTSYQAYKVTCPEIDGKWDIAEIPGVMQEDGTINNICCGSGSGCAIMKASKEKQAAWEFIKWWVSADTQYRYSAELEAILGDTGRQSTSNVEALSMLSWDTKALDVINSQWKKVEEIDEVPGSYYVARSIDQAFWAVKNGKSSSKEAIMDWAEISDKEIARKMEEYADVDPDEE